MTLVIDADYMLYVTLYHFKKDDLESQCEYFTKRMDEVRKEVEDATGSQYTETIIAFSDLTSFRNDIYPDYKKGRKPRPAGYLELKAAIGKRLNVQQWDNFEADDICGWYARYEKADVASQDNDVYNQVPIGYDIKHGELHINTPNEMDVAMRIKAIDGDRSDKIKGLPKQYRDKMKEMLTMVPHCGSDLWKMIDDREVMLQYNTNLELVDINLLHEGREITWS